MGALLTSGQVQRALNASAQLAELSQLEEFPKRATDVLRELIPCDHCGYNALNLESGTAIVVANPEETVFEGGPQVLAQLGHQNPLIVRALAGDLSVQRLSDHITRRQLHRTELYQEVYRRISLEYQLAVRLPDVGRSLGRRPALLVALSLARKHRDFSAADQLMLTLLRPHFAATLERLHQLALTRAVLAGLQAGGDRWVVLVDREDVIAWASDEAERAFGARVGERLMLEPQLTIRRIANAYPGLDALHIARAPYPGAEALRQLGLTRRQTEVMKFAIRGLSAKQIADTLVLSRRTVEKHFEAIYAHLGVNTRAQAIAAITALPLAQTQGS